MFHLATSTLTQLLASYGYLAVLLFVAIESSGTGPARPAGSLFPARETSWGWPFLPCLPRDLASTAKQ